MFQNWHTQANNVTILNYVEHTDLKLKKAFFIIKKGAVAEKVVSGDEKLLSVLQSLI